MSLVNNMIPSASSLVNYPRVFNLSQSNETKVDKLSFSIDSLVGNCDRYSLKSSSPRLSTDLEALNSSVLSHHEPFFLNQHSINSLINSRVPFLSFAASTRLDYTLNSIKPFSITESYPLSFSTSAFQASPIFYCQSSNLNYNEYHFKSHSASMPMVNLKTVTHSNSKRIKNSRIKIKKRSWHRAVFSNLQRCGLETAFCQHKYITKPDRKKLADRLGLKDEQVKVWFQNRRMKMRHKEYNLSQSDKKDGSNKIEEPSKEKDQLF